MDLGAGLLNTRLANWIKDYIKGAESGRGCDLGKTEQESLWGDGIVLHPDCSGGLQIKGVFKFMELYIQKKSILMYLNFYFLYIFSK